MPLRRYPALMVRWKCCPSAKVPTDITNNMPVASAYPNHARPPPSSTYSNVLAKLTPTSYTMLLCDRPATLGPYG